KVYNPVIGRPGINTRLMVSLHYLKYAYNLSDRAILEFWVENPYWQYFSGMEFFVSEIPIHYSSMCRWRQRVGESGVEKLLKETIKTGMKLKIIKNTQLKDINDTTVQEKYVRFPTDSRLYFRSIQRLVKLANKLNVRLRLKYTKLSKHFLYNQIRYMNTEESEKVEEYSIKLKTCLGTLINPEEK
ncbi:MAG: transposase, partial [Nanoarchaeota archaeon]|nr:transposase [Nanoarchaeota archaeon]